MLRTSITLSCVFGFVAWYYGRDYLPLRKANYEAATNESTEDSPLPVLTRLDPVKVGHVRDVHIMPGKVHKMRTLSLRPLIFEIEDFLTPKECDDIIYMAQTQGMDKSLTVSEAPVENNNENEATVNQKSEIVTEEDSKTKIVPPDDPVAAFQRTDINDDGKLDLSEIKFGLRALGSVFLTEDDFTKIMSELELDPNNDGVVTYEEYIEMAQNDKLNEIIAYLENLKEAKPTKRTRTSYTAFLDPYDHLGFDSLFEDIKSRIQTVSGLPIGLIRSSEALQVLQYKAKQHYHCHYDTEPEEDRPGAPCCHHLRFAEIEEECRPCRFMTFFYYLHEPEEGGETAFPIADNETIAPELINTVESYRCDLSTYCHKANLVYKPKKGAAILWYNHLLDEESGWLGPRDDLSYHGGCDVIKGTKWAANNWLNAGRDREKDMAAWKEYAEIEALETLQRYNELTKEEEGKDERSDNQQSINNEGPLGKQQENVQQKQKEDKEQEPVQEEEAKIQQEHKEEYKNKERVQEEQVKIRQEA